MPLNSLVEFTPEMTLLEYSAIFSIKIVETS
jgi:hypothetical protein